MSLHRDSEELFTERNGLLLAQRMSSPHTYIRVLTADGKQVGTFIDFGDQAHAIHWRTQKGDNVQPATLEALVERCAA